MKGNGEVMADKGRNGSDRSDAHTANEVVEQLCGSGGSTTL